ncbi:MAG: CooT family nickel-binding protein [Pseudomonadota bacterium]
MCLAKLYPPGAQAPVMENITQITLENGKIIVESLFGEKQVFEDTIQMISFTESRVQLIKAAG